jgi:hypothetical protein
MLSTSGDDVAMLAGELGVCGDGARGRLIATYGRPASTECDSRMRCPPRSRVKKAAM